MRAVAALVMCLLLGGMLHAAEPDTLAPAVVDQLLARAADLQLSAEQVGALRAISQRRVHTLEILEQRLRASEADSSATATQDSMTLMQEMGRLRVLSGAQALQQLSAAQRQQWIELRAHTQHR